MSYSINKQTPSDKVISVLGDIKNIIKLGNNNFDVFSVMNSEIVDGSISDENKDLVINKDVTENLTVSGNTVVMSGITVTSSVVDLTSNEEIVIENITISGSYDKSTQGNAVISLKESDTILIENMTFDASTNFYNGIEIGNKSNGIVPRLIEIKNCKFLGKASNNAINIFRTADNAVVNIENCEFDDVSNVIRYSNANNVRCTIDIKNCKCSKWDTSDKWAGMIICQDYISKTEEEFIERNEFSPNKLTINVINCIGPKGKITSSAMSEICGTQNKDTQFLYVYFAPTDTVYSYDSNIYPKLVIK